MVVGAEWTSLEIAKLAIATLTPILLFVLGLMVSRAGRRVEQAQWTNRKLIERRLELYDQMAPMLNDLFVFFLCVGHFKEIDPPDALSRKRDLDRIFYANVPLFSRRFGALYEEFSRKCFLQFTGDAQDAKLRTSPVAQRIERGKWETRWDEMFTSDESSDEEIEAAYDALMDSFAEDVGVVPSERGSRAWLRAPAMPVRESRGKAGDTVRERDPSAPLDEIVGEGEDALPTDLADDLRALQAALDDAIPSKRTDGNLLVGTWNLRALGDVTDKWRAEKGDPQRDLFDIRCIAEIVSRFDVVAVQEVRGNLTALQTLLTALGPNWSKLMTDVTRGKAGNSERMAFVFDLRRARPSGLVGELARDIESETSVTASDLDRQFARTPYAVSFETDRIQLTLVTLHVLFGEGVDRAAELREIAAWLARWAREERHRNGNLIALGDFSIDRRGDPLFDAFTSTGIQPAPGLNDAPRTIFGDLREDKFCDQIAWFTDEDGGPILTLEASAAGWFDFVPLLQGDLSKTTLSWKVSDHYPLWVEFSQAP